MKIYDFWQDGESILIGANNDSEAVSFLLSHLFKKTIPPSGFQFTIEDYSGYSVLTVWNLRYEFDRLEIKSGVLLPDNN